jgi:hypothetical protein
VVDAGCARTRADGPASNRAATTPTEDAERDQNDRNETDGNDCLDGRVLMIDSNVRVDA